MDIDIILEPDLPPSEIVELGKRAEELGIRGLWTSNYFAHWDGFMSLVPLAMATSELRLGVLAVSPFEMHPLKIANALLTLNEMSGGRAQVAMGAGEGNITAMNLTKPKKQVLAIREAIEIVKAAARGGLTQGFEGEIFQVKLPCAYPWVESTPPIVYGTAYRPMMMKMEGRVADGCFVGCNTPEMMADAMANVNVGRGRRENPDDPFCATTFWGWHIKKDREKAYAESRRELPWRARLLDEELICDFLDEDEVRVVRENYDEYVQAYFDPDRPVTSIPEEISNKLCDGYTSTGGLEDLDAELERFGVFAEAGLTEIALRLHDDPMEGLEIIGELVVPALRD